MISLIIPVYNRAREIKEFLGSLITQIDREFEVVIVDDGSSDNLKDVIEEFRSLLNIQYLFQENQGPASARNLGMSQSKGNWYVFIDSDCTLPEEYLSNLKSHIKKDDFDAFGGPDTYKEEFPDFLKAIDYCMTSFIGTGGARGTTGKKISKYYPRSFNMGIRKEIFENISGMCGLRHGQDLEYSNRIYKAGYRVKFLPDVYVYHRRRISIYKFFKQIFNWGVARINLGKLDSSMLKPIHCLPFLMLLLTLISVLLSLIYKIKIPFLIISDNFSKPKYTLYPLLD